MNHVDHREIRYRILKLLQIAHPYWAPERTLWLHLNDAGMQIPESEIGRHTSYLRDKEYIESKNIEDENFGETFSHKLTAKGIDLLERRSPPYPDPGVSVPRVR